MFSQRTTTIILVAAIGIMSYQTVALAAMSKKISDSSLGLGSSPTAVSFTDGGSAPAMVGGC